MAAFHLIIYGRFWAITEGRGFSLAERDCFSGKAVQTADFQSLFLQPAIQPAGCKPTYLNRWPI